jgi:hypothetical protein
MGVCHVYDFFFWFCFVLFCFVFCLTGLCMEWMNNDTINQKNSPELIIDTLSTGARIRKATRLNEFFVFCFACALVVSAERCVVHCVYL